jgi:phosphoribosylaminoimidazole (AIR) synthetase
METAVGSSRHWESALEPAVVVGQAVVAMVADSLVGCTAEPVAAVAAAVAVDTPEADCVLCRC